MRPSGNNVSFALAWTTSCAIFFVKEVESINIANCKVILSEKSTRVAVTCTGTKFILHIKNGSQTLDLIAPTLQMCNNWVKGIKIATKHLAKKIREGRRIISSLRKHGCSSGVRKCGLAGGGGTLCCTLQENCFTTKLTRDRHCLVT